MNLTKKSWVANPLLDLIAAVIPQVYWYHGDAPKQFQGRFGWMVFSLTVFGPADTPHALVTYVGPTSPIEDQWMLYLPADLATVCYQIASAVAAPADHMHASRDV